MRNEGHVGFLIQNINVYYIYIIYIIHNKNLIQTKCCWFLCLFTSQLSVFDWSGSGHQLTRIGELPKCKKAKAVSCYMKWTNSYSFPSLRKSMSFHHVMVNCQFVLLILQPCEEGACFHQRFSLQEMNPKEHLGKSVESQHLQKCRKKPTGVSW